MSQWFWYVVFYSFLGYCLEKLFAWAIHSPHQIRRCFLLLPLCPVYGLAMAATLALIPENSGFLALAVAGGLICTAVEYLVHVFYDKVLGVWFWDYRDRRWNLRGRVCPQFALAWGILSALAVRYVQPWVHALAVSLPPEVTFALWMLLAVDGTITAALLWEYGDIDLLTLPAVLAQVRASSQSNTSR